MSAQRTVFGSIALLGALLCLPVVIWSSQWSDPVRWEPYAPDPQLPHKQMMPTAQSPLAFNDLPYPRARNQIPVPQRRPARKRRGPLCDLITDGTLASYIHELAHCNGWDHPENIEWDEWIPPEFIHPYYGPITITIVDNGNPTVVRNYAQKDAKIRVSKHSAEHFCGKYKYPIAGCAPVWPPYWQRR